MFQGQLDFFKSDHNFLIRITTIGFNMNPMTYNVVPFLPVSPKLRTMKFATVGSGQYYKSLNRCFEAQFRFR